MESINVVFDDTKSKITSSQLDEEEINFEITGEMIEPTIQEEERVENLGGEGEEVKEDDDEELVVTTNEPIGIPAPSLDIPTSSSSRVRLSHPVDNVIGFQVKQLDDGIFISQLKYANELVKKFGMKDSKHVQTPMSISSKLDRDSDPNKVDHFLYRSMIGSLLYLAATRLDILFSVGVCARYQADPKEQHILAVKCIIHYVNSTLNYGLRYSSESNSEIAGYTDANWAGNKDDRKSTSGGCFYTDTSGLWS
ncbi:uncharacterized mitochondrial protein AtMg00810-like [Cornus florida]|uniref:uncharacterized mitochondrial protein AtMg00810-like n=1 Tax=Cornus florida TaxID=4283 RepID=UPI0028A23332|nr:uncharacterized mitochondrial protein AtMg00810-like [Cornus florida]